MVRLAMLTAVYLGYASFVVVKGEEQVPAESCETSDWHVPDDEVLFCCIYIFQ